MTAQPTHLMTIAMGNACGLPSLSGPPNTTSRASSNRAEVTCPACLRADGDKLRALVWDMLSTMGPSRAALGFAIRAGQLGVRDAGGSPLVPACMHTEAAGITGETAPAAHEDTPRADIGAMRDLETGTTWITWDDQHTPPWTAIADAVSDLSGGTVLIRQYADDDDEEEQAGDDHGRACVIIARDIPAPAPPLKYTAWHQPASLPADPFGASAFRSHAPGCGCPLCEGAIADAADESRRAALELAHEDGDFDNCEPTL